MRNSKLVTHPIALLTSLCLSLGACTVEDVDTIESATEEIDRHEVINTNEIVDNGTATVHMFESDDMVYTMKIGESNDGLLAMTYSVESDEGSYENTVEYDVVEIDGGMRLIPANPDNAEAASLEIQERLAGTEIEEYLTSGDIDLTAGIDKDELAAFRSSGCTAATLAVTLICGPWLASLIFLGGVPSFLFSAACLDAIGVYWLVC